MQTDAIGKIRTEICAANANPYVKLIGNFLIQHLEAHPQDSGKIMADGKTIAKSLDAMKSEAKKKQQGGMAMLTDMEGYAIVLKYFGINGAPVTVPTAPPVQAAPVVVAAAAPAPARKFDVKLDDFL